MLLEIETSGRFRNSDELPCQVVGSTSERSRAAVLGPKRSVLIDDPDLLEIVTQAKGGDREAQSELVRRYSARIAGFVRPMVRSGDAVEDIVQLIMIKMCRRLPALREAALFESWLFMLSRNTVLDQLRRAKCRPVMVMDPTPWLEQQAAGEESGRCSEILEEVERATRHCSAKDRRILHLVLDGASYQKIAELEGLTMGALKLRVHRLRLLLRANLRSGRAGEARSPRRAL